MTNNFCYKMQFSMNNGVMQISKEIANESVRLHRLEGLVTQIILYLLCKSFHGDDFNFLCRNCF